MNYLEFECRTKRNVLNGECRFASKYLQKNESNYGQNFHRDVENCRNGTSCYWWRTNGHLRSNKHHKMPSWWLYRSVQLQRYSYRTPNKHKVRTQACNIYTNGKQCLFAATTMWEIKKHNIRYHGKTYTYIDIDQLSLYDQTRNAYYFTHTWVYKKKKPFNYYVITKKHICNIELVMKINLKSHQRKRQNKHQQYKTKKNIHQHQQQQQTFLSPKRPTFQLLKIRSGNTHDLDCCHLNTITTKSFSWYF